jgi:hypothetical protein
MKNLKKEKEIKFKVEVNPFLREAIIKSKIEDCEYAEVLNYEDIDEWQGFVMAGKMFDIHFYYEEKFEVSIYPVNIKENSPETDVSKWYKVDLKFKMTS